MGGSIVAKGGVGRTPWMLSSLIGQIMGEAGLNEACEGVCGRRQLTPLDGLA